MEEFDDYYELMQISPHAEPTTVTRVYRMLAARYHPDNPETGDLEKFVKLQKAYDILANAETRAEYDVRWKKQSSEPMPVFELKEFVTGIDAEVNRRLGILCLLYNSRRSNPESPGMSVLDLEARMSLPREHLEFTIWYLRDKGYARRDEENSQVLITSGGVDFVEQNLTSNRIVYKLLKPAGSGAAWSAGDAALKTTAKG